MRTKRDDGAPTPGVFFGIDPPEKLAEDSGIGLPGFYGWTAYCVLFASLDPRRLAGCEFSDGDVLLRGPPIIEAFCIGLRFSEPSQIAYVRDAIDTSGCPALLPPPHRFGVLQPSPLVRAGRVDDRGCFVVNADWAYPRRAPADTVWRLKMRHSR